METTRHKTINEDENFFITANKIDQNKTLLNAPLVDFVEINKPCREGQALQTDKHCAYFKRVFN